MGITTKSFEELNQMLSQIKESITSIKIEAEEADKQIKILLDSREKVQKRESVRDTLTDLIVKHIKGITEKDPEKFSVIDADGVRTLLESLSVLVNLGI